MKKAKIEKKKLEAETLEDKVAREVNDLGRIDVRLDRLLEVAREKEARFDNTRTLLNTKLPTPNQTSSDNNELYLSDHDTGKYRLPEEGEREEESEEEDMEIGEDEKEGGENEEQSSTQTQPKPVSPTKPQTPIRSSNSVRPQTPITPPIVTQPQIESSQTIGQQTTNQSRNTPTRQDSPFQQEQPPIDYYDNDDENIDIINYDDDVDLNNITSDTISRMEDGTFGKLNEKFLMHILSYDPSAKKTSFDKLFKIKLEKPTGTKIRKRTSGSSRDIDYDSKYNSNFQTVYGVNGINFELQEPVVEQKKNDVSKRFSHLTWTLTKLRMDVYGKRGPFNIRQDIICILFAYHVQQLEGIIMSQKYMLAHMSTCWSILEFIKYDADNDDDVDDVKFDFDMLKSKTFFFILGFFKKTISEKSVLEMEIFNFDIYYNLFLLHRYINMKGADQKSIKNEIDEKNELYPELDICSLIPLTQMLIDNSTSYKKKYKLFIGKEKLFYNYKTTMVGATNVYSRDTYNVIEGEINVIKKKIFDDENVGISITSEDSGRNIMLMLYSMIMLDDDTNRNTRFIQFSMINKYLIETIELRLLKTDLNDINERNRLSKRLEAVFTLNRLLYSMINDKDTKNTNLLKKIIDLGKDKLKDMSISLNPFSSEKEGNVLYDNPYTHIYIDKYGVYKKDSTFKKTVMQTNKNEYVFDIVNVNDEEIRTDVKAFICLSQISRVYQEDYTESVFEPFVTVCLFLNNIGLMDFDESQNLALRFDGTFKIIENHENPREIQYFNALDDIIKYTNTKINDLKNKKLKTKFLEDVLMKLKTYKADVKDKDIFNIPDDVKKYIYTTVDRLLEILFIV
jgi:hypothetical protein